MNQKSDSGVVRKGATTALVGMGLLLAVISGGCAHGAGGVPTSAVPEASATGEGATPTGGAPASSGAVVQPSAADPQAAAPEAAQELGESLGQVALGMPAGDAVTLLGPAASKEVPTEWGADGLCHGTWTFPPHGLELDMAANCGQGEPSVAHITASTGCIMKTDRGIGIGSSRAEVEKAYPPAQWATEVPADAERIIVGSVYGGILFRFEGSKVVLISIGAFAE